MDWAEWDTEEQVAHQREHGVVGSRGFAEEVLRVREVNLHARAANRANRHTEVAVPFLAVPQADAVRRVTTVVVSVVRSDPALGKCRLCTHHRRDHKQGQSYWSHAVSFARSIRHLWREHAIAGLTPLHREGTTGTTDLRGLSPGRDRTHDDEVQDNRPHIGADGDRGIDDAGAGAGSTDRPAALVVSPRQRAVTFGCTGPSATALRDDDPAERARGDPLA